MTINLGVVDLGQIGSSRGGRLLFESNRLIWTAIRNQLSVHADEVKRTIARRTSCWGCRTLTRADLSAPG
jgi:hypothetical protein